MDENLLFHNQLRLTHETVCTPRNRTRSAARMHNYWRTRKSLRKHCIASVKVREIDTRPYVNVKVFGKTYLSLLDSGATITCFGSALADEVISNRSSDLMRFKGNVKTADGQIQRVAGIINVDLSFGEHTKVLRILVVPELKQNVICGIDFWNLFDIKIVSSVSDISSVKTDEDNFDFTSLQRQQLDSVIAAFPSSEKEGLGRTTLVEHVIDTGEAKPIKQRFYQISPAREKILCDEIDRMLALGVIEEAEHSPWSSPGVLVIKPGKVRFCLDSRRLNEATVKDAYPMPNIDGLLSRLTPVHIISKIDLKDAFWQVSLSKDSKPKTAFSIPNRPMYQFCRMPFGLCNAPQTLCRLMDKVISYRLRNHVFVYLDDLLVVSNSFEEHMSHLCEVAQLLRKAGLTINIGKSSFGLKQVKYLGYVVGNGSIMTDSEKVRAILEYPAPRNVRQLRQFLGMAGWYRRFVEDFATITFPLTELQSKRKTFRWTSTEQEAFEKLKTRLATAPVLVHPDYGKRFIVQCDASSTGLGAVLAQADENGVERPIAYMSKKLNGAQRNYTVTELECLAVVVAIKKFRIYIEGHDFTVVTDHASLKWLMHQKDLSGRLARWALKLQGYNFIIEHRRGRENVVPDALSRKFEGEDISQIDIDVLPAINLQSAAFESSDYKSLREETVKSRLTDYMTVDKFVYYRANFDENSQWKLIVPKELREEVIIACHTPPTSAQNGIAKTLHRIRRFFYWPGMVADVRRFISDCDLCKTSKIPNQSLRPLMGNISESQRPFQKLYVDLIGPFPRSRKGNIGICIVLDHFSKFTFLKPLRKFCSRDIIKFMKEEIFHCFGVPETIVSDNGSQFRCKEFADFAASHGVNHVFTAVHAPQSNASERVNRSINEALRSYIRKDQREWDIYLSSINSSLRSSIHQSIGISPYYVVFGQNMLNHGDDYKLMRKLDSLSDGPPALNRTDRFQYLRDMVVDKMRKAYERNAKSYNLRSRKRSFQKGQVVIRRSFPQSSMVNHFNAKLAPVGIKACVLEKIGNCNYRLEDCETKNVGVFHAKDIW